MISLIRLAAVITCLLALVLWIPAWIFTGRNILDEIIETWDEILHNLKK